MASGSNPAIQSAPLSNDDIGLENRLELFRLQVEIRDCEKRAHDLFFQNLIKGTSHLSIGQEASRRVSASPCERATSPSALIEAMLILWRAALPWRASWAN
jgi:TPP-dependent pyruvate/acetoin dehydrogenase alpha subunit